MKQSNLTNVLRGAALTVVETPGWANRDYAGQDLRQVRGVLWHHTATNRTRYVTLGRADAEHLHRRASRPSRPALQHRLRTERLRLPRGRRRSQPRRCRVRAGRAVEHGKPHANRICLRNCGDGQPVHAFRLYRSILVRYHACPLPESFLANKIGHLANRQKEKPYITGM
jgi:hypothetical protein